MTDVPKLFLIPVSIRDGGWSAIAADDEYIRKAGYVPVVELEGQRRATEQARRLLWDFANVVREHMPLGLHTEPLRGAFIKAEQEATAPNGVHPVDYRTKWDDALEEAGMWEGRAHRAAAEVLEMREKFGRLAYLGNVVRSLDVQERDELNRLLQEAGTEHRAASARHRLTAQKETFEALMARSSLGQPPVEPSEAELDIAVAELKRIEAKEPEHTCVLTQMTTDGSVPPPCKACEKQRRAAAPSFLHWHAGAPEDRPVMLNKLVKALSETAQDSVIGYHLQQLAIKLTTPDPEPTK